MVSVVRLRYQSKQDVVLRGIQSNGLWVAFQGPRSFSSSSTPSRSTVGLGSTSPTSQDIPSIPGPVSVRHDGLPTAFPRRTSQPYLKPYLHFH